MSDVPRGESFSLLWRVQWRLQYGMLQVFGPASQSESRDPRVAMRRDYDRRRAASMARKTGSTN